MDMTNEKLLNWALNKIQNEYKDDVCLLIGYDLDQLEHQAPGGPFQYFKGAFDYFVPATEKGYGLSQTFMIDGIGYDLYPRSWERVESMARLEDYNTCCLGDATILYARTEEDRRRFTAIQEKLRKNLGDPGFMFKKALEKLNVAMGIYQTMMFTEEIGRVRMAAGFIADFLSTAIAFVNGTYFKHSQVNQIAELCEMSDIPEGFIQYYQAVIKAGTIDELKKLSHLIIHITRRFLDERKPEGESKAKPNYQNLANWYQELSYTWRRIYQQCYNQDTVKAFVWGCALQHELDVIKEEFDLEPMDLMGSYQASGLAPLQRRAEELEAYILSVLSRNGIPVASYNTVEDFLAKN